MEYRHGLKEQAREHCGRILKVNRIAGRPERLLGKVFPGQGAAAEACWRFLRQTMADAEATAVMKRLTEVLDHRLSEKDLKALTQQAQTLTGLKPQEREDVLLGLAQVALTSGHEALGRTCLDQAVEVQGSAAALQRLGDHLAEHKEWTAAAERYARAWAQDSQDPLPLFLRGHALLQAGQEAEGKKWIEMAHLLPLGNENIRSVFAGALARRNHIEAARRESDLLAKTATPGSFLIGQTLPQAAFQALARKDYLSAADCHERAMLRCLSPGVSFLDPTAYIGVPLIIHRLRARGLAAAGKFDIARQEIDLCQALRPADVDLPIALVPILEKQGRAREADDLFRRNFTAQEQLCRDYPQSAWAHNSAAWLAACCRRELDRALEHALKAVALAPRSSGYQDTLGEVYFQRGDKDRALAAARKSLELDPQSTYFRKQLKRIEAGDRLAELPPTGEED